MQHIGRYQLQGEIARGGMGVVYRALDPATGGTVAVKVMLNLSNPTSRKRFAREAEALARVQHPNVVRLHAYELTPTGAPYMAMEFVEGESLQSRLDRGGPFDPDDAADVATTLCRAVSACHAAGILHRDLKPDNVLVARDGTLKLTDFGLVRDTEPSQSRSQLSRDGSFLGSPGYWAPEQARGALDQISERTDVYGLGATLFALLTGRPPHSGGNLSEILRAVVEEKPPPSSISPAVPAWLDRVVDRALATEPERRFASVDDLLQTLEARGPRLGALVWVLLGLATLALVGVLITLSAVLTQKPGPEVTPLASHEPESPTTSVKPAEQTPVTGEDVTPEAREALERGVAHYDQGRYRDALAAYDEAMRLQPEYVAAYYGRGVTRNSLGDYPGAIEDYTEVIRLQPEHPDAYSSRGVARGHLGDWQGQLDDCNLALDRRPDFAEAYFNRGLARGNLGDPQGEIDDCTEAIRLQANYADAYNNRGVARGDLGDPQGAIADYDEVIRLEPDNAGAHNNRAVSLGTLGDYKGAVEDYDEAIRLRPDNVTQHFNRAVARGKLGDDLGAIEDYTEAIRLQPDLANAYRNRGSVRGRLGDLQGEIQDYTERLRLEPDNPAAYARRGDAYWKLSAWKSARDDYDSAIRLDPDHTEAFAGRGRLSLLAGDPPQAVADLRRALELTPNQYTALWYAAASGDTEPLDRFATTAGWRSDLVRYFLGRIPAEELLNRAGAAESEQRRSEQLCEGQCFIGLRLDLTGDAKAAKGHYQACVSAGVSHFLEHQWAQARLRKWEQD